MFVRENSCRVARGGRGEFSEANSKPVVFSCLYRFDEVARNSDQLCRLECKEEVKLRIYGKQKVHHDTR